MKIGLPLSAPDKDDGQAGFAADADEGSPASAAVEFGHDDACEADGLVEFFGLDDGVCACGGVHDEPFFVRGSGVQFGEGAADFAELLHEIVAGVKAAGGVADEEIGFVAESALHGLVADGGGVGAVWAEVDGDFEPGSPEAELLDGGGAEGVGGGEEDGVFAGLEKGGEFGGGGGFACAVDAGEEDDAGGGGEGGEVRRVVAEEGEDGVFGCGGGGGGVLRPRIFAEALDDGGGGGDAEVGLDERFFDLVEINGGPGEAGEEF